MLKIVISLDAHKSDQEPNNRLGDCILRLVRKFMNWEILYNSMKYISQKYSKGNVLKERERERTKFPCLQNVLKTQNLNLEIDVSAVIVLTRN